MTVRYRGWRFVVPGRDERDPATGLRAAPTGALATVEDDDAIRQALLLLLSTRPGERVMRPEYGCDLHKLIFAPNDDTTAGLAMRHIPPASGTSCSVITVGSFSSRTPMRASSSRAGSPSSTAMPAGFSRRLSVPLVRGTVTSEWAGSSRRKIDRS